MPEPGFFNRDDHRSRAALDVLIAAIAAFTALHEWTSGSTRLLVAFPAVVAVASIADAIYSIRRHRHGPRA